MEPDEVVVITPPANGTAQTKFVVRVSEEADPGLYHIHVSSVDEDRYSSLAGCLDDNYVSINVAKDNDANDSPAASTAGTQNDAHGTATTVTVDVGGKPQQSPVQSGMGATLMTRCLPVNITDSIVLTTPVKNLTVYPVNADWDGVVRGVGKTLMRDENNAPIAATGFGHSALRSVHATCTEPYFVEVKETNTGKDGIKLEKTTEPVSSAIYWGDTFWLSFAEPQSGDVNYTTAYGIVPEDYNNVDDRTARNNGAGNQELSGLYHLSFTTFHPATINLPEQADVNSFLEVACDIDEDSGQINKEFSRIFVYDVWFRME